MFIRSKMTLWFIKCYTKFINSFYNKLMRLWKKIMLNLCKWYGVQDLSIFLPRTHTKKDISILYLTFSISNLSNQGTACYLILNSPNCHDQSKPSISFNIKYNYIAFQCPSTHQKTKLSHSHFWHLLHPSRIIFKLWLMVEASWSSSIYST